MTEYRALPGGAISLKKLCADGRGLLSWNWIWYAIARLHRISMFVTKPRSQGDDALKACGLRWEDGSNLWFQ